MDTTATAIDFPAIFAAIAKHTDQGTPQARNAIYHASIAVQAEEYGDLVTAAAEAEKAAEVLGL